MFRKIARPTPLLRWRSFTTNAVLRTAARSIILFSTLTRAKWAWLGGAKTPAPASISRKRMRMAFGGKLLPWERNARGSAWVKGGRQGGESGRGGGREGGGRGG